ncbi:thiamine phosphate synthase [Celeribacter indicus]|uniref:Thiamine monophosphate synthase n=1 Tax=Celeribacter indicus TaxID=1208324 RepID=A0A0B5E1V0_9RHOB|nr:thiamine phosphate synthase [Celeribacter indicus]AJE47031.1 thiamine monophosphate synthase [Celeribacter indicus]SDW92533.1 thiamine-phosphate pyrophosphorylase [Celeribacter indicus]
MPEPGKDLPQIYLLTPTAFDPESFAPRLAAVLEAHPVACVRLALASKDEYELGRAADACREVCHARDVAIVIESHVGLAERHGLDGVHLTDGPRSIRKVRKVLGEDAIVGAFCGASRHDGMTAGEIGADYVAFGPVGETGLGDGTRADRELFEWWSAMIEVPVVAEGALSADLVRDLAPVTDFFAIGDEIWSQDDPVGALGALIAAMG